MGPPGLRLPHHNWRCGSHIATPHCGPHAIIPSGLGLPTTPHRKFTELWFPQRISTGVGINFKLIFNKPQPRPARAYRVTTPLGLWYPYDIATPPGLRFARRRSEWVCGFHIATSYCDPHTIIPSEMGLPTIAHRKWVHRVCDYHTTAGVVVPTLQPHIVAPKP